MNDFGIWRVGQGLAGQANDRAYGLSDFGHLEP